MKRIKYLISLVGLFIIPFCLNAASVSISGPSSVYKGSNVTVSINVNQAAAWNIRVSGSGSTSGCSARYADVTSNGKNTNKSFRLTCKANNTGSITFKVTGDITSADGNNKNVSSSKTVTVNPPREKETISTLKSLSVKGFNITPSFKSNVHDYKLSVEPTVNSITINASALGKYARVSGAGVKNIEEGDNIFTISVTAENGAKTNYKLTVSVIDKNPIKININDKEYTVIKTRRNLKAPNNYKESTYKIDNQDVPSYISEDNKLTLIAGKDKDNNINYIVVQDDNKYKLYNEFKSNELVLFIEKGDLKDYLEEKIKINDKEVDSYKVDERFHIVYAMNLNNGKYAYYKYDNKDNTFQEFVINKEEKEVKKINPLLITNIITLFILIVSVVYIIIIKSKK